MKIAARNIVKLGLLAGAIIFAAVGMGQGSQPASAAHTQILLSYSSGWPVHAQVIVVTPNGLPRDIYAWVVGVDEPSGASAYRLEINFDSSLLTATAIAAPASPLWLGSGGRSASCPLPTVETGLAYMDCITVGQVPPFGAMGTGLLGSVRIDPGSGSISQTSSLDLTGSYLIDTPTASSDFDWSYIPVTLMPTVAVFMNCADFNGDGNVDLLGDILGVIQRYQWTPANQPDDWDPIYDLNEDGVIDLLNDILGAIIQYQLPCNQPT